MGSFLSDREHEKPLYFIIIIGFKPDGLGIQPLCSGIIRELLRILVFLVLNIRTEVLRKSGKAGSKVSIYITPIEDAWKLEIVEGHWGPTYTSICSVGNDTEGGKFTEYDLAANGGCYILELTQEMYDNAIKVGGWGGVFVLNGDNVKVTKVTLLP